MKKSWILHIIFWVLIPFLITFILWVYQYTWIYQYQAFFPDAEDKFLNYWEVFLENTVLHLITLLIGLMGFYVSYFLIMPKLLYQPWAVITEGYFLILLIMPALMIYVLSGEFFAIYWSFNFFLFVSYIITIISSLLGAFAQVSRHWKQKEQENMQLEKNNLESQLALLKTQISPHFLFNTINNIDILIEQNPKVASQYLRQLSKILRFMLYHTNSPTIPLQDEIQYLENYIALQKIRSVNPDFVSLKVSGVIKDVTIAPLIFIVFVENAFKYVADKKINRAIEINLSLTPSYILFTCKNTIAKNISRAHQDQGIGIPTVKRRLDLLYPQQYDLQISSNGNYFEVTLQIERL